MNEAKDMRKRAAQWHEHQMAAIRVPEDQRYVWHKKAAAAIRALPLPEPPKDQRETLERIINNTRNITSDRIVGAILAAGFGHVGATEARLAAFERVVEAARDFIDTSPIGDNDAPYPSDINGSEFNDLAAAVRDWSKNG